MLARGRRRYGSVGGPCQASGGESPRRRAPEEVRPMADQADPTAPSTPAPEPPPRAATYTYEGPDLRGHAEALRGERVEAERMGGAEKVEKQHTSGKLSVRERLGRLFDAASFQEFGL